MQILRGLRLVSFLFSVLLNASAFAGAPASQYSQLGTDTAIGPAGTDLLSQTIFLNEPSWVYLQSDGRAFPSNGAALGVLSITVNGGMVGNASVIDWSQSNSSKQHSFNVIGAAFLGAGAHTISLRANSGTSQTFTVGADSNLSSLIKPANTVSTASRGSDSNVVSHNVNGLTSTSVLPTVAHINVPVNGSAGSPLVLLSSARIYRWGNAGDPLTTIGLDGNTLPNNQASWSDNDIYEYAEHQAPFFTHALIENFSGQHTASLLSTALPYLSGSNNVQYRMGGDSTLIALQGGMSVVGAAPAPTDPNNVTNYLCIASDQGWPGCPAVNTAALIAQADLVVPAGHNGVVLFTGKTRIQADGSDPGGTVLMYLTIDGAQRGSWGVQELAAPSPVSTRTMGASYLATGGQALTPGVHRVALYAHAIGSFKHLSVTRDLPLIWFD
jgi:hypothetical protein